MRRAFPTLLSTLVIGAILFAEPLAGLATDWLWFRERGLEPVFLTLFGARAALGFGVGAFVALMVQLNGRYALGIARNRPLSLPQEWAGGALDTALRRPGALERAIGLLSLAFGGLLGLVASTWWTEVLLAIHGGTFGYAEPILGLDAGFYAFELPAVESAVEVLGAAFLVSAAATLTLYLAKGAIRIQVLEMQGRVVSQGLVADAGARRHLASLSAALLLCIAVGTHLDRFGLLYAQGGLFAGPGYTDVQVMLPLLTLQAVATAFAAFAMFQAIDQLRRGWFALGLLVLAVPRVLTGFLPGVVQQFTVLPNELDRESYYISEHLQATRFALGFDRVEERSLSGEGTLTREDVDANRPTIQNVRLWDHGPLLDTFRQVQEIRTYYDFSAVDNDRYLIDGELRQVMISPRELVPSSLPDQARTWVNESMTYTHGYGVALGPVNQVSAEGLPELFVKDLPPKVRFPDDLGITRPELYYGESMTRPVFVLTGNPEFDYPAGEDNVFTTYQGSGGIPVGGLLTRALISLRTGSLKVLLTDDIVPGSRVLLYRTITERVKRIAPFLTLDADPYLVIHDGRLVWILDAYTATDRFPYAARTPLGAYVRNSVKVVVDAYDGEVRFYRTDIPDPIADAWSRTFPGLLRPLAEMPEGLRAHLRYPADLFAVQARLFATYHMQNEQIFYNREDEWEVPEAGDRRMEPYYTIMKLPGEAREEFILMLPFTPRNKPNLAAWMVARADGDAYGTLRVYKFPKEKMVYGPNMVVARINQNDAISEKLSLWNQQGSSVELGTLLVIPIEESLVYVQPLYLKAASGSIPELKRVIVGYENRIAMEATLEDGLRVLFGAGDELEVPVVEDDEGVEPVGIEALIREAVERYRAARTAAGEGSWEDFGRELDALGTTLERMAPEEPGADAVP